MSDLVGNPEDRFSRVAAQIAYVLLTGIHLQYTGRLIIAWTEQAPGTGNRRVDIKEFTASEDYFNAQQILSEKGLKFDRF